MSTTQIDRLRALLEPLATASGFDLEEIKVTRTGNRGQLQVDVDADGGIDLDAIARLSREIGQALDDSDVMGSTPYVLEVGSPGVDRLLTAPRHWRRAEGRLVTITLADGGEILARVLDAHGDEGGEESVLVEVQPVKGRGRAKERRLSYAEIAKARVQVEFNRKDDKLLEEGLEAEDAAAGEAAEEDEAADDGADGAEAGFDSAAGQDDADDADHPAAAGPSPAHDDASGEVRDGA